jgi:hypothetical protein
MLPSRLSVLRDWQTVSTLTCLNNKQLGTFNILQLFIELALNPLKLETNTTKMQSIWMHMHYFIKSWEMGT